MTIHFRRDREPEMTKRAPPLGYFISKAKLNMLALMLEDGLNADAHLMIRQWLSRTPRMPTKAEESHG